MDAFNQEAAIDPARVPRLFGRFYRAERSRTDSAPSTGLGLAIVASIMALHGGRVELESGDRVTTFRLMFPCDANAHADGSGIATRIRVTWVRPVSPTDAA